MESHILPGLPLGAVTLSPPHRGPACSHGASPPHLDWGWGVLDSQVCPPAPAQPGQSPPATLSSLQSASALLPHTREPGTRPSLCAQAFCGSACLPGGSLAHHPPQPLPAGLLRLRLPPRGGAWLTTRPSLCPQALCGSACLPGGSLGAEPCGQLQAALLLLLCVQGSVWQVSKIAG